MDVKQWFKHFIIDYRAIVEKSYKDQKDNFPFCSPVDITIYLVEDPLGIFSPVTAFFSFGLDEDWPANDLIITNSVKLNWKNDPRKFDAEGERYAIEEMWHTTFYDEVMMAGLVEQESFKTKDLEADPIYIAKIFVQRHLIKQKQREHYQDFTKLSDYRFGMLGKEQRDSLLNSLTTLKTMKDEEKAETIAKLFWLMGFETLNVEKAMKLQEYKELENIAHVDVIAVLPREKILVALDEGEISAKRWYKLYCLDSNLKILEFLGTSKEWKVIQITVGKKSPGITYLKGDVKVISLESFSSIFQKFMAKKTSVTSTIRMLLGYDIKFFERV